MTESKSLVFSFANFQVREREFCITKGGEVLAVEPKAFRVLLVLLRHPHRLIRKEELLDAVWADCTVSENTLARSIAQLRRLIGDDTREPRFIATVPTLGYRFLCDVKVAEDAFSSQVARQEVVPGDIDARRIAEPPPIQDREVAEKTVGLGVAAQAAGSRNPRLVATAVLVVGFSSVAWVAARSHYGTAHESGPAAASVVAREMRTVPLTNLPAAVDYPSFSPDGEKIAFIWYGENPVKGDVYVQMVGDQRPLRLTHTSSGFTAAQSGRRTEAGWLLAAAMTMEGRCSSWERWAVQSAR